MFGIVGIILAISLVNLIIDLFNAKTYEKDVRYVLTRKVLPYKVIKSWGMLLRPIEANVFNNIEGDSMFLYDLTQPANKKEKQSKVDVQILEYDLKGINIINKTNISFCAQKAWRYISGLSGKVIKKFKKK